MKGNRMRKISAAVLLLSFAMSFSAFADGTGGKAVRIISYDLSLIHIYVYKRQR